jgi:hypothetical protein
MLSLELSHDAPPSLTGGFMLDWQATRKCSDYPNFAFVDPSEFPRWLSPFYTLAHISQPDQCPRMSVFLNDATHFILTTSSVIQTAPLQLYSSTLIFAPGTSMVRAIYDEHIAEWILLKLKAPMSWDPTQLTLEDHKKSGTSVVFFTRRDAYSVSIRRCDDSDLVCR